MDNNRISSKEVGLEIGLVLGRFLFNTEHLHYGYWPDDLPVKPSNLKEAQGLHSKLILDAIPEGVQTILDVGSGSGGLAGKMIAAGYQVHCVSPSEYLADRIEENLGEKVRVFRSTFEDLILNENYDLVLFSESFQYVKILKALNKVITATGAAGHLLICDFFRRPGTGSRPLGGGHDWTTFQDRISELPLQEILNKDITTETAPTMDILTTFINEVAEPVQTLSARYLDSHYPGVMKMLRWYFAKRIAKINRIYFSGSLTSEMFNRMKTYRLLLYRTIPDNKGIEKSHREDSNLRPAHYE
ncbi:uncharacterized protein METZ01_LOCUS219280 [marine metagenome]|uniref:Methyltransferase domain-containing protein n=1 Tax=marine metagenome TaxID=408172 RepID=A0A382FTM5_9ZZZZ|tara:strand:- start:1 stop:903 length:903 start_codon:yes stop_codon:yes gene_type:complete